MSRVFNERTQKWTEERLATVAAVDAWLVDLKSDWRPYAWYQRDWAHIRDVLDGWLLPMLREDRTTRRAVCNLPMGLGGYWPCLATCQFLVRGDRLIAFFYWRSSSSAEQVEDNKFMRWVLYQVALELGDIRTGTIVAFRASDHDVLEEEVA